MTFTTAEVFVAGGRPTITYNPRDDRHLEQTVRDYLAQPGKALSVSGPTKSGKSVLIERLLPKDQAAWIYGPDLSSTDGFWSATASALDAFESLSISRQEGGESSGQIGGTLGVPGVASISPQVGGTQSTSTTRTTSRTRPASEAVREVLARRSTPIVIDDFHYIEANVKRGIARAIKTLIPTTHVVLIAVPHEAFDVVRHEPDMDGRVWQLGIQHWNAEELKYIARAGFEALNVIDSNAEVATQLADASYGAPFLMQQLCHDYMVECDIRETVAEPYVVSKRSPEELQAFFQRIANRSVPGVFDRLLRGPDVRGQERVDRVLRDRGVTTDIYGAVLYSIGAAGYRTGIRTQDLRRILEAEIEDPPGTQQIASTLNHMREIAFRNRGASDPALDFKDGQVHVLDPFLAFYLRYGSWLPEPTESA